MIRKLTRSGSFWLVLNALLSLAVHSQAQTVQPVLAEYTGLGSGTFVVSNSTFASVAVVLEPQSFSIDEEGTGLYRQLDAGVHVDLSRTSLRLGPRESETIFYKVSADRLPAWLTIYATFAPLHPGPGVNVHIMLPHTVYVYSKERLKREDLRFDKAEYDPNSQQVVCQLTNVGRVVARAAKLEAYAGHNRVAAAGFPLLPGATRRIAIPWTSSSPPQEIAVDFESFSLKDRISGTSAP